uniref:Syndecan n=1 Tax=Rhipicephalus zambeziensis TaxID=60191 RepID=A0A224YKI5_9ACAR
MWKATLVILLLLAVNGVQLTAEKVQSTKEKHGDNGMFFIDDPQSDQAVEGSADFEDTDASSGIGDDEDAEGSGDEHLSEEEMGSGTVGPVFVTPKVTVVTDTKRPPKGPVPNPEEENTIPELSGPVTSTKRPRTDLGQGPPIGGDDDDNLQSNNIPLGRKQDNRPSSFFAQPGILAAVIGGAVVGLLCAILLVMFIVYRMRKKDEGSYALDEPKRSPTVNSYMRSSNKEFYA